MKRPASNAELASSTGDTDPSGPPAALADALDDELDSVGGRPRVFVQERADSAGVSGARYYSEAHEPKRLGDAPTVPDARVIVDGTGPGTALVGDLPPDAQAAPRLHGRKLTGLFFVGLLALLVGAAFWFFGPPGAAVAPTPSSTAAPVAVSAAALLPVSPTSLVAASAVATPSASVAPLSVVRPAPRALPLPSSSPAADPKRPTDMPWTID